MQTALWISLGMIGAGALILAGLVLWFIARAKPERAVVVHPPRPQQRFDHGSFRFDMRRWLADALDIDNLTRKWRGRINWPSRRSRNGD